MILDKIEVSYPRAILKYKVKFVENRKPTYVEFIILQILFSYGDKEQTLKKIIANELGVTNTSLFDRAFRDLVNFSIVKLKNEVDIFDYKDILNIKINELVLSESVEFSFRSKSYMMSNIVKYLELKCVYDPLYENVSIVQKIEWDKKHADSQCVYKLFNKENIDYKINTEEVKEKTLKLMKQEPELFGENCNLVDIELMNDASLSEVQDSIDIYYEYENIGHKVLINFEENKYVIDSECQKLLDFFKSKKRIESEFVTYVFDMYNKKIEDVIKGKIIDSSVVSLNDAVLMQDFPAKNINFDFLMFNFNDLNSRSKFLERSKYIQNSNIIFEYNINGDEVRIGFERKKILVATHKLKNLEEWKKASIVYLNFKKNIEAYNVEKVFVPCLKEHIYVARFLPDFRRDISVDLDETFKDIREIYQSSLKFGDYDKMALCIGLLSKLNEISMVERIMIDRFSQDLFYAKEYLAIKKSLSKYQLKEELLFVENLIYKIIISSKEKMTSDLFLKLVTKYNISNNEILINLVKKIDIDFSLSELYVLNKYLIKHGIDGWKLNINNCLNKFIKDIWENEKTHVDKSSYLSAHNNFMVFYKSFESSLTTYKTYEEISSSFTSLNNELIYLIQNIDEEMINKVEYLNFIGKILNKPIKLFKGIILKLIEKNSDSNISKVKMLAYKLILNFDQKLVKQIRPNTVSEYFEINKAIFKFSNDIDVVENNLSDEYKFNEAMDIFFKLSFETPEENVARKIKELGGE